MSDISDLKTELQTQLDAAFGDTSNGAFEQALASAVVTYIDKKFGDLNGRISRLEQQIQALVVTGGIR